MRNHLFMLLLALPMSGRSFAGEYGFETTSQGIVVALTRPVPEQPAPEIGLTRSFIRGARAIEVIRKDYGKTVEETVMVKDTPAPHSVHLNIQFDTNLCAIRADSFPLLNELGKTLTHDKIEGKSLVLKGHTDSDGPDAYNLTLRLNRALSVWHYLICNFNIDPDHIRMTGYGEAVPLAPNTSAANKQLNRRVEIQASP
jgi:outer membrane protein OmpA-like peptidoglycan-associated protein